jgi:hypothetical protein
MVFLYGGSIAEIGTPREYTVSSTEYHTSPVKRIVGILVAMMKEATETYRISKILFAQGQAIGFVIRTTSAPAPHESSGQVDMSG